MLPHSAKLEARSEALVDEKDGEEAEEVGRGALPEMGQ